MVVFITHPTDHMLVRTQFQSNLMIGKDHAPLKRASVRALRCPPPSCARGNPLAFAAITFQWLTNGSMLTSTDNT
jgi:hypothetical protein